MTDWNPRLPGSWAQLLGLVSVPMFGAARSKLEPGTHALMLDGDTSFVWSIAEPRSPILDATANRWSWSSNVRWSVALNSAATAAEIRRWDTPGVEHRRIATKTDAIAIFESFRGQPHPTSQTVIERGLLTFHAVRQAIENKGGDELDVVLAFNTVLALAKSNENHTATFIDAVKYLHGNGDLGFSEEKVKPRLRRFPMGDLTQLLLEGESPTGFLLDADLLIRHASGTLYQEAHKQLTDEASVQRQQTLPGILLAGPDRNRGPAPSDIHHTPPSLARALSETALRFVKRPEGAPLQMLDPACGSGVFLIEALRSLKGIEALHVRGIDSSDKAKEMADFCVRHTITGIEGDKHSFDLETNNSLEMSDWGSPNLILMNPPFRAWNALSKPDQSLVSDTLGPALSGRPDIALAFVFKAAESLAPGGVLASVVPSTFLESESAEIIRNYFTTSGQFCVHLIGQFGYGYFDATVQPAFFVLSKSKKEKLVRVVIADDKENADNAIRSLRSLPWNKFKTGPGYELQSIKQSDLPSARWTPIPQATREYIRPLIENTFTVVGDFFVPRLGIRVGNKQVLMLTAEEASRLLTTKSERSYFRPIADKIDNGVIREGGYVFYPYEEDGTLRLQTEPELRKVLPLYFAEKLKPARGDLEKRKSSYREWWEVSEPVKTWLAKRVPRIVAKEFGRHGDFAVDLTGKYAVVQGYGWCWKNADVADPETLLAYLSILNSTVFDRVLEGYCPRLLGKQYVLRRHFVERAPLPALDDKRLRSKLAAIGRMITEGKPIDEQGRDTLVLAAFGVGPSVDRDDAKLSNLRLEREFKKLASRWEAATAIHSRADLIVQHPLYREIVALGEPVVPLLLKAMRDKPSFWSAALRELTGENPVPQTAHKMKAIAAAWIKWGREHGHDV